METAKPPASAVVFEISIAVILTSPVLVVRLLLLRTVDSVVFRIVLPDPAPARERANPPDCPETAAPMV